MGPCTSANCNTRKGIVANHRNICVIYQAIAYRAGVVLERECLVFSQRKLWPPSLILMAAFDRIAKRL